ncbi:MAG: DUF4902 domain-containing protein [Hydrogenophaga sp.]|nr:DUF4902 domain-containing protein [Hydrogenophaga sp.]
MSTDFYVRISPDFIEELHFEHHSSECLLRSVREGFTQWTAALQHGVVAVSWDWRCLDDGAIVQRLPRTVLSNAMLVDVHGCDRGAELTELELQRLVERIDWQPTVAKLCRGAGAHRH